jgi:uncharacterized protein
LEQRLSLLTLAVRDLARSRAFYEQGLGWKPANDQHEGVVFYQLGGMGLVLWGREALAEDAGVSAEGSGFAGVAMAHNVRSREEVDAVLAEAVAAGGTLHKPGAEAFWGGYTGYFADPDGHLWEVAYNPGFPLDAEGRLTIQ